MTVQISATVATKIGFASHQNAVPVLRELELSNSGSEAIDDLTVELLADPAFLEPKTWRVDRLREGSTVHVTDRDVKLNAGFLAGLAESVSGTLTIRIVTEGVLLASRDFPVEVLGRAEWGGAAAMPELLAAFVTPNDPAVDRVLKAASEVLRRAGKKDAIDGYEGKSRTRVWELASAVWSAVASFRISYTLPPASFEAQGQKIRSPSAILDRQVATCLDTALLFAAALEQAGLNPLLVLTQGHAFVGVWLQPQEFSTLVTDDPGALRKRIDLKELIVFETTLVTQTPAPGFAASIMAGQRQIAEDKSDAFVMALDVRRARMQRIRPLAVPGAAPQGEEGGLKAAPIEALEEAPVLPGFDVEISAEPNTPAGRIALWQRKLLDLTTRNRLLNLPEGAKAVRLVCPEPARLEDRLAAGKKIKIVAMPDLTAGGRDEALHEQQTNESLRDEYARAALERDEVLSLLEKPKLDAALVDLYRKARSDLDEGGANTLFLGLGFLKWKKSADDPRTYRAPLILLPVRLERKSALSGVVMVRHDDEPRFNLTLLELLRQDFELTIPALEKGLPTDECGVDVNAAWTIVRRAVRDIPHFEVVEELVVGTFSFAKYLMWKDLADRSDQLKTSPVVKHLIERAQDRFPCGPDFPKPEELDEKVDPSQLFTPLAADSSQIAAVVASAEGCDFVLDGPPGTGKSQTIANMIAHNLALGRRVLFVAEKMAALDVVHRRLEEKGLGEFCLELHSNKTSKVEVLKRLERAWDTRDALTAEEWHREASQVQRLRDRLNEVVRLLHRQHPNGMTLHQAVGRVVRDWTPETPELGWHEGAIHDQQSLDAFREIVRRLDLNWPAVQHLSDGTLGAVLTREWSNGWQERVLATTREVRPCLKELAAARDAVLGVTRLPVGANDAAEAARLLEFATEILSTHGLDMRLAFTPDFSERVAIARRAIQAIEEARSAEATLSVRYPRDVVTRLDLDQFDSDWAAAGRRFWLLATFARKKVVERLRQQSGAGGIPDPGVDLPVLRRIAQLCAALAAASPLLAGFPHFAGLDSDTVRMREWIDRAERLRASMSTFAEDPDQLVELRQAVTTLVVDGNELLGPGGRVAVVSAQLEARLATWRELMTRFEVLLEAPESGSIPLDTIGRSADEILSNRAHLKAWCDWQRIRREATDAGLGSIVRGLESGAIPSGRCSDVFETAHAKWFASRGIDAEPRLRMFVTAEHTSDIEAFRRLDERLSSLSVRYIRARLCGLLPDKTSVGRKDGYGVLKHELQKQRAHKPIRQLAIEMGEAFTRLAPCMLMSPLSIAQYLPPDQALFDLVIFDEASQIAPWDAIGSIARGRQVVIAGDPRQMPPTSFFNRGAAATDDDVEADMESILDECLGAGVPSHGLSWHYRSRHESLIAFSNHRYYDGKLITFPAAVTRDSAVEWRRVDGVYAKGRGRTNQAEAEAIVAEVVKRLTDPGFAGAGRTLGVVTLNSDQQTLIENLLDIERKRLPEIERFFGEDVTEPTVVKNLETVQGDERDLILLGIGYGPTEPGARTMSMSFGPLNREGGWRRLNVALTRARQEMVVFTSFDPGMVDLNRTSARAVRDLKHYLEFADRGPSALGEAVQGSVGGHESPFEEAVASALSARGWIVVPQIGVSRFRIDLGVVHPDRPGDYLAGVECDGAAYHGAATARDRDKVRAAILTGLGWNLVRVWSTDWWVDKQGSLERLHASLQALLDQSRAQAPKAPKPELDETLSPATAEEPEQEVFEPPISLQVPRFGDVRPSIKQDLFARAAPVGSSGRQAGQPNGAYRAASFAPHTELLDPLRFYDPGYDQVLEKLVTHVVETEAPIAESVLVQRIARAHGFQRAGRVIRDRVMEMVARHHHAVSDEAGQNFVWGSRTHRDEWIWFRRPASGQDVRSIEEISIEELRAAASHVAGEDRAGEVARLFGVRRVSASARRRLEIALARASESGPNIN